MKFQGYFAKAEADKNRYITELKEYQQSEAYQSYVKKKKEKGRFLPLYVCERGEREREKERERAVIIAACIKIHLVGDLYFSSYSYN